MTSLKLGLWVSALALMALTASCGSSNIGSPIQDDLNADYVQDNSPNPESLSGNIPTQLGNLSAGEDSADAEAGKGVSFTPGLPVAIPAGFGLPNILRYGWRGGNVTEGAAPNWVKLNTTDKRKPAWIIYGMQEAVVGRLQQIRIHGAGTGMQVHMYNWNTASWVSFGMYNLNAGPANLAVPLPFATNGMTYLRLSEPVVGGTRIDKIETNVF